MDRGHWVILLVAAPWLLFPAPACSPLMLVASAVWIVTVLAGREAVAHTPSNASVLVLAAVGCG